MKSILYSLILILPLTSWADSFQEFKAESVSIVQSLLSQNITQVGNIDIAELEKKIAQTKWDSVKDKFLLGSGEQRSMSIYLVAENKIIVNELALKLMDKKLFPQASLHEVLGANGYDDEGSKISLSLDQIAKNPTSIT
ncbi:MAG: hypothetical protein EOP06_19435, partial [Proteobacteria bacterium]